MRPLLVLALLAAIALPALAARRVTVSQLEEALTAAGAAHKAELDIVRLIGSMELSERLTELTLGRLNANLKTSSQVALALQLLADQSAFLDPPVSELPAKGAPDNATQQRMLVAARSYVAQTLPGLPNFLATRITNRFDDSPHALKEGGWPVREGLHLVYTSSKEISIRSERDNQSLTSGSAASQERNELTSWGEFGYLLGIILADTVNGKVTWSHWEQTATGTAAVFDYQVPSAASHYEVIETVNRSPRLSNRRKQPNTTTVRTKTGYHGSLWLDPASGTIRRITIQTDAKDQFRRAAVMVQYEPVQIGDSKFICPVRSLALYYAITDANATLSDAPTEWLNTTVFTAYHRFAATTRILSDEAAPK
jgi:hypothetical protein